MVSLAALASRPDDIGERKNSLPATDRSLKAIECLRDQEIALEVLAVDGNTDSVWLCPLCVARSTCTSQERGPCSKGFTLDESDPVETEHRLHTQLKKRSQSF